MRCDPAKTKVVYKKDYDEETDSGGAVRIKVFVVNSDNFDMPVPCQLQKDKSGKWKILRFAL